jgi:hypothetical protein
MLVVSPCDRRWQLYRGDTVVANQAEGIHKQLQDQTLAGGSLTRAVLVSRWNTYYRISLSELSVLQGRSGVYKLPYCKMKEMTSAASNFRKEKFPLSFVQMVWDSTVQKEV